MNENLLERINELENMLRSIRYNAAYNLYSPGNEDDTLTDIVYSVDSVLYDNFVFEEPEDV